MNQKNIRLIFQTLLTLMLFSLWAAFALLVVNKLFYKDLPGYTIGRICIWEVVALIISGILSQVLVKKWGSITIQNVGQQQKLVLHPRYGWFFLIYFIVALLIGIWQFWLFSQKF